MNALTQVTDSDQSDYLATVTCDANGNITQITERTGTAGIPPYNYLYTYFEYDDLNRLTVHKDKRYVAGGTNAWVWTKRSHEWDAQGRLVHSNYRTWNDGGTEPGGDSLEHIYAGSQLIQNYDGTSAYGVRWHWAGAQNDHGAPLRAPNSDTGSKTAYNIAVGGGAGDPQRFSYDCTTITATDKRLLFAQGRPMAKDSSGSGSAWATGTMSDKQTPTQSTVESRLFFTGTVASTDMSRATDKREKDRMGVFGTSNSYAGSYGRVTSEPIGRDLNPLGRGDGQAYLAGMISFGQLFPSLPSKISIGGTGNSVNNCGCKGIGNGCGELPEPGLPPEEFDPGFNDQSARRLRVPPVGTIMPDWNPWRGEKNPHWNTDEDQRLNPDPEHPGWWVIRPPHLAPFPPIGGTLPAPPPPTESPDPPKVKSPLPPGYTECEPWGVCPPGYRMSYYPDPNGFMRCVCLPPVQTPVKPGPVGATMASAAVVTSLSVSTGVQTHIAPLRPLFGLWRLTHHKCVCHSRNHECQHYTYETETNNPFLNSHAYEQPDPGCRWDVSSAHEPGGTWTCEHIIGGGC